MVYYLSILVYFFIVVIRLNGFPTVGGPTRHPVCTRVCVFILWSFNIIRFSNTCNHTMHLPRLRDEASVTYCVKIGNLVNVTCPNRSWFGISKYHKIFQPKKILGLKIFGHRKIIRNLSWKFEICVSLIVTHVDSTYS